MGRVKVTKENATGRNVQFKEMTTGKSLTNRQFVNEIEHRAYSNTHHVRVINGAKLPFPTLIATKRTTSDNYHAIKRSSLVAASFYISS